MIDLVCIVEENNGIFC